LLARIAWPGSPRHLALVRAALGAYLISVFTSGVIPLLLAIPATVYPGTRSSLPLWLEIFAAQHLLRPLLLLGLLGSVAMVLGVLTRAAVWLTLIAYLVTQNFYYRMLTAHDDWVYFTFYLVVLAFARCADTWSLDALIKKRPLQPAQQYRWPVELMGAWLSIVYAAAGIAKLFPLRKGIVWANGLSLQGMVTNEIHESPIYWLLGHSLFDYRQRAPFVVLGLAGALVELSALTVLWSRPAAKWVALAIIGLHASIGMFGITGFLTIFLVAALVWLDPQIFEADASRVSAS
jgi:hypothetical protein